MWTAHRSTPSRKLAAWALMLVTLAPIRMLQIWLQGRIAIAGGGLLKVRLLAGALRLEPDEIRHRGAGQFLGR
jgi:ATP-binding cassette, subfamily B, bacterial